MLKLKLQYFGHLMRRADSFEKTLLLGKIEGRRRRGWQRMRWLDGITNSMNMNLGKCGTWWWTGRPGVLQFMESQRVGHDWATELNWTDSESWNWDHHKKSNNAPRNHTSQCMEVRKGVSVHWHREQIKKKKVLESLEWDSSKIQIHNHSLFSQLSINLHCKDQETQAKKWI